jgi:hypothetical protein
MKKQPSKLAEKRVNELLHHLRSSVLDFADKKLAAGCASEGSAIIHTAIIHLLASYTSSVATGTKVNFDELCDTTALALKDAFNLYKRTKHGTEASPKVDSSDQQAPEPVGNEAPEESNPSGRGARRKKELTH